PRPPVSDARSSKSAGRDGRVFAHDRSQLRDSDRRSAARLRSFSNSSLSSSNCSGRCLQQQTGRGGSPGRPVAIEVNRRYRASLANSCWESDLRASNTSQPRVIASNSAVLAQPTHTVRVTVMDTYLASGKTNFRSSIVSFWIGKLFSK